MGRNKLLSFSTHRGDFLMWTGLKNVIPAVKHESGDSVMVKACFAASGSTHDRQLNHILSAIPEVLEETMRPPVERMDEKERTWWLLKDLMLLKY